MTQIDLFPTYSRTTSLVPLMTFKFTAVSDSTAMNPFLEIACFRLQDSGESA